MKDDPHDREIRNYYLRNRAVAVQRYLGLADNARSVGAIDRAEAAYRRALRYEPDNERARPGWRPWPATGEPPRPSPRPRR